MDLLGMSLEGTYDLVPPPELQGWGFKSLKRGIKRVGRGAKKVGKKGLRGAKKVGKTAVKLHMKPVKLAIKAGKAALMAAAKLAAKPVVWAFRKLARRRANYVALRDSGTVSPTGMQKKEAAAWALGKVGKAGPMGKLGVRVLKFVGAHKSAGLGMDDVTGSWDDEIGYCGMSGAEIAAAAAAIVRSINKIMGALNRPGDAPSNPQEALAQEKSEGEAAEESQPVEVDAEEEEESTEEDSTSGLFSTTRLRQMAAQAKARRAARQAQRERVRPRVRPRPNLRVALRLAALRKQRGHGARRAIPPLAPPHPKRVRR